MISRFSSQQSPTAVIAVGQARTWPCRVQRNAPRVRSYLMMSRTFRILLYAAYVHFMLNAPAQKCTKFSRYGPHFTELKF